MGGAGIHGKSGRQNLDKVGIEGKHYKVEITRLYLRTDTEWWGTLWDTTNNFDRRIRPLHSAGTDVSSDRAFDNLENI